MLYEIMKSIKNFFLTGEVHIDTFKIEDGVINLPFLKENDYFMVQGSRNNDGVYQYKKDMLIDEEFYGEIAVLAPPKAFIDLCNEINAYDEKMAKTGVFTSESFGGYSYSLPTSASGGKVSGIDAYKSRLNAWRKV